jgi:hypothetical protein
LGGCRRTFPELSIREAERIATAFELCRHEVLEDATLVAGWREREQDLQEFLNTRHGWDASMAPVYLVWLRGEAAGLDE